MSCLFLVMTVDFERNPVKLVLSAQTEFGSFGSRSLSTQRKLGLSLSAINLILDSANVVQLHQKIKWSIGVYPNIISNSL